MKRNPFLAIIFCTALLAFALPRQAQSGQAQIPFYSVVTEDNVLIGPYDGSGSMRSVVGASTIIRPSPATIPAGDFDGNGVIDILDLFPAGLDGGALPGQTRDLDRDGMPGLNQAIYSGDCPLATGDPNCADEGLGYNRRSDLAFGAVMTVLDPNNDQHLDGLDDTLLHFKLGFMSFHWADWLGQNIRSNFTPADKAILEARTVPSVTFGGFPIERSLASQGSSGATNPVTECYEGNAISGSKIRYTKGVNQTLLPGQSSVHEVYKALNSVTVVQNAANGDSFTPLERSADVARTSIWPFEMRTDRNPLAACQKNFQILLTDGADTCAVGNDNSQDDQAVRAYAYLYNYTWDPITTPGIPPAPLALPYSQPALGNEAAGVGPFGDINFGVDFFVKTYVIGTGDVSSLGIRLIRVLHRIARAGGTDLNADGDSDPNTACITDQTSSANPGYHADLQSLAATGSGIDCSLCTNGQPADQCKGTAAFGSSLTSLTSALQAIFAQIQTGEYFPNQPLLTFSSTSNKGLWTLSDEVGTKAYKIGHLRFSELDENFNIIPFAGSDFKFDAIDLIEQQLVDEGASDCVNTSSYGHDCRRVFVFDGTQPVAGSEPFQNGYDTTYVNTASLDLLNASMPVSVADCDASATVDNNDALCAIDFTRDDYDGSSGVTPPQMTGSGPQFTRDSQHTLLGLTANKPVVIGAPSNFELLLLNNQYFDQYVQNHSTDPQGVLTGNGDGALHFITEEPIPGSAGHAAYQQGEEVWMSFNTPDSLKEIPYNRLGDRTGMNGQCVTGHFNLDSDGAPPSAVNGSDWHRLVACAQDKDLTVLDLTNPITPQTFGSVTPGAPDSAPISMYPLLVNIQGAAGQLQAPVVFVATDRPPASAGNQGKFVYMYRADDLDAGPVWTSPDPVTLPAGQNAAIYNFMGFIKSIAIDSNNDLFPDLFYFLTRGGLIYELDITGSDFSQAGSWNAAGRFKLVWLNLEAEQVISATGTRNLIYQPGNPQFEDVPSIPQLNKGAIRITAFYDSNTPPVLNLLVSFGDAIDLQPQGLESLRWLQRPAAGSAVLPGCGAGLPAANLCEKAFNQNILADDPYVAGIQNIPWDNGPPGDAGSTKPITFKMDSIKTIADVQVVANIMIVEFYDKTPVTPPCSFGRTIIAFYDLLNNNNNFDLDPVTAGVQNAIVIDEAVASPPLISVVNGSVFYAYKDSVTGNLLLQKVSIPINLFTQGLITLGAF